mmetsp:Transcript_1812/g.6664  ORF Transcript_1812/g.6664 Transcript_1812/m.6664 type:complete len:225 (-) Transcript_1812:3685-4359(-)
MTLHLSSNICVGCTLAVAPSSLNLRGCSSIGDCKCCACSMRNLRVIRSPFACLMACKVSSACSTARSPMACTETSNPAASASRAKFMNACSSFPGAYMSLPLVAALSSYESIIAAVRLPRDPSKNALTPPNRTLEMTLVVAFSRTNPSFQASCDATDFQSAIGMYVVIRMGNVLLASHAASTSKSFQSCANPLGPATRLSMSPKSPMLVIPLLSKCETPARIAF